MTYIDLIGDIAADDVRILRQKDAEYGGSWLKRGGIGAYMMACRKFDRLEEQVKKRGWDVIEAALKDNRQEGITDDIDDLRRYLLLIRAEIAARRIPARPEHSRYLGLGKSTSRNIKTR